MKEERDSQRARQHLHKTKFVAPQFGAIHVPRELLVERFSVQRAIEGVKALYRQNSTVSLQEDPVEPEEDPKGDDPARLLWAVLLLIPAYPSGFSLGFQ